MSRAVETARPDRLFDDPLAASFLDAGPVVVLSPGEEDPTPRSVIGTRFFDDYLTAACSAGCQQVVLLAAGLDTRAFRLSWPTGVRLWELDRPDVLEFKQAVLDEQEASPRCWRSVVPTDLLGPWPADLLGNGFVPSQPTAWLIEGFLVYLTPDRADRLLTVVSDLSAVHCRLSLLDASEGAASVLSSYAGEPALAGLRTLWPGGLGEDAAAWLAGRGWRTTSHEQHEVAAAYGRPNIGPAEGRFVIAVRKG